MEWTTLPVTSGSCLVRTDATADGDDPCHPYGEPLDWSIYGRHDEEKIPQSVSPLVVEFGRRSNINKSKSRPCSPLIRNPERESVCS